MKEDLRECSILKSDQEVIEKEPCKVKKCYVEMKNNIVLL